MKLKLIPEVHAVARPQVEAEFLIATPMYLHGADVHKVVERILPASVKGALRFWWRAVHWKDYYEKAHGDTKEGLRLLADADARLWGAADETIGQGRVLISVESPQLKNSEPHVPVYLKGQEVNKSKDQEPNNGKDQETNNGKKKEPDKQSIEVGQSFKVICYFKSTDHQVLQEDLEQVCRTLKAWGLLGGLGRRARHGLGSVQIQSLSFHHVPADLTCHECDQRFDDSETVQAALQALFERASSVKDRPPFTALSARSCCYVLEGDSSMHLLSEVAQELRNYRAQVVEDKAQVLNFALQGTIDPDYPKRAVFGLPHNYFFKDEKIKVQINGCMPVPQQRGCKSLRRASPLFIHVAQFNGSALGVLALLEADFLPEGGKLMLKVEGKPKSKTNSFVPDWQLIRTFMFETLNTRKVWPK